MNTYREIMFGSEAIKYIYECLKDGKTLSRYLLEKLDLKSGKVTTFLPADISDEEAKRFTEGKLKEPPPQTHRYITAENGAKLRMVPKLDMSFWLINVIQTFLNIEAKRCCIFEDANAQPNDPYLASIKTRFLIFNEEVYHFLLWKDLDAERILKTIRHAESWLFIGAMTSIPEESVFSHEAQKITIASDELIRLLAERTEKIVVGAYDGEGYLIWSKR